MLFVSNKYESLDTIFEDEMINEARSIYSDNQEINDFIIKRDLPNIKDHLESAYSNDGFKNASSPWFLIFNDPKKNGMLYFTNTIYGKENSDKLNDIVNVVKELFSGLDVQPGVKGNTQYFTVTDTKGKIIGGKRGNNGKGDKITFRFKGTGNTSTDRQFPSSTEMEMVIAFVYNKVYGGFADDDQNATFVGIPSDENVRKKYYDYFENNEQVCRKMAGTIRAECRAIGFPADSLKKMQNKDVNGVSDAWNYAGSFGDGEANITPKTDLISGNGKCKLSLKNADKGAQAMSGGFRESKATMMCVLAKILDANSADKEVNGIKLSELQSKVKNAFKDDEDQARDIVDDKIKNIGKISNDIIDRIGNLFREIKNASDNSSYDLTPNGKLGLSVGSWLGTTSDDDLKQLIMDNPEFDKMFSENDSVTKEDILNYVNSIAKKADDKIKDISLLTKRHVRQFIHNQMAKELTDIMNSSTEFRKAVMREAMTGEIKFGGVSPDAIANAVLTWSFNGDCEVTDIYKYADKHSQEIRKVKLDTGEIKEIMSGIDTTINFKGSDNKSYTAMRFGMKKVKPIINFDEIIGELDEEVKEIKKQTTGKLKKDLLAKLNKQIEFLNSIKDNPTSSKPTRKKTKS